MKTKTIELNKLCMFYGLKRKDIEKELGFVLTKHTQFSIENGTIYTYDKKYNDIVFTKLLFEEIILNNQ